MIDDIVEMILKEARAIPKMDLFDAIIKVHDKVWDKTYPILSKLAYDERRKIEDKNKGG